ncbi:PHP domain-containing protein [Candidatus Woesearchaeota archaeon]|nr:PHP domain-containing protein [Candidatus Woesearchaeota archaeon]
MLKSNFHTHTNFIEKYEAEFSPRELINLAAKEKFKVFSITEHGGQRLDLNKFANPLKTYFHIKDYAKYKQINLIPGAELNLEKKDVLLINYKKDLSKLRTFADLEKIKDENVLIMAPHPFYGIPFMQKQSLSKVIKDYKHLFDAIEHSNCYTRYFNINNNKAIKFAKQHKIPLITNSDAHFKIQLIKNYSILNCENNIDSILESVKKGKFKNHTEPLTTTEFVKISGHIINHAINPFILHKLRKQYSTQGHYD